MPRAEHAVAHQRSCDQRRPEVRTFGRQRVILSRSVANDENFGTIDVCFYLLHFSGEEVVDTHNIHRDQAVGGGGRG